MYPAWYILLITTVNFGSPSLLPSHPFSGKMAEEVKAIWRKADCVCFDVDSTVCRDEGIDELAKFLGCGEAIEKM